MSEAIKVLLPKTKRITVCGRDVEIKPLTLKQIFSSLAIIKEKKVNISIPAGSDEQAAMMKVFMGAGDALQDLFVLFAGLPSGESVEPSLEDVSELALALCEVNDFKKIFSNFQKATELAKLKK